MTIITDGSLAGQVPQIPPFRPATAEVFAQRAARLRALAPGHAMETYLRFAAALSQGQQSALDRLGALPVPDEHTLTACREHGMPPLSTEGLHRDARWREVLREIVAALDRDVLPREGAEALARLSSMDVAALEASADGLLQGRFDQLDAALAPFIGAALQVYWVKLAVQLGEAAYASGHQYGLCPVCASYPVASVVRIGGAAQGLRYLVCALCTSQWHVVRVKCTACASTAKISYLSLEGAKESLKAEVCAECQTYCKVFYMEKDAYVEPAADDLATLALDMLVFDEGFHRLGPNLLLSPGA
ncbi:MAG TPA: formate dehydrogenase accessory protein FdhE [Burkholderiales bacterium]|nr:formate dehydrogenase accessory protein FdhE [Burkholderiales bacterium]